MLLRKAVDVALAQLSAQVSAQLSSQLSAQFSAQLSGQLVPEVTDIAYASTDSGESRCWLFKPSS